MVQIKDLHEAVIDALKLHSSCELPVLKLGNPERRLVVASGNAFAAGKIIFQDEDAVFASESLYKDAFKKSPVDGAVVISASGKKHAPLIIAWLLKNNIDTYLLTCDKNSEAAKLLNNGHIFETKHIEEPITYNTSTYMGMILAKTGEDPEKILDYINNKVDPLIPDMTGYNSFYFILESGFDLLREMFLTKFDELFCPMVYARCYTVDQTLHAKTVIESEKELFISFGYENNIFGKENARLNIPLPKDAGPAALMAVGYYVIGKIQSQFPPWFKENAERYAVLQVELFKRFFK